MRTKLLALGFGAIITLAGGIATAAADTSVNVASSTSVSSDGSSTCASQSTQVQANGQSVVDRTDGTCAP